MIDFKLTQSFLNPSSIAIIGASSNEKKLDLEFKDTWLHMVTKVRYFQ